jgi:hypothetical protein
VVNEGGYSQNWQGFSGGGIIFQKKWHGLSLCLVDQRRAWSMVDRPQSSTGLGRAATPGRGSSAARRENGGGDVTQSADYAPILGQRRGGGALAVGLRLDAVVT